MKIALKHMALFLPVVLILVLSTSAAFTDQHIPETKTLMPGDPAPVFQIDNWLRKGIYDRVQPVNGRLITVVEFWADWCPLCRTVLPIHDRMQARLQEKGVRFVAVAEGEINEVRTITSRLRLRNIAVAYDNDEQIFSAFLGDQTRIPIPFTVIIEQSSEHGEGRLLWKGPAVASDPELVSQTLPAQGLDDVISRIVSGKYDLTAERVIERDKQDIQWIAANMWQAYYAKKTDQMMVLADHALSRRWPEACRIVLCAPFVNLADMLLDTKDADKDQRPNALKIVKAAMEMNKESGDYAVVVSTYARALFANGDVKGAVEAQQRALDLRMDYTSREECERALAEYQAALSGKSAESVEAEKSEQAKPTNQQPKDNILSVESITSDQAMSDLTALHNCLRLKYAAYDDIAWRLTAEGSSWAKHNAAFLARIKARQDWPVCDYFDLLSEYLNVVRDCHFYMQGAFSRGGEVRTEQSRPTTSLAPFFTDIRVREQNERMILVQAAKDIPSGAVLSDIPVIDSSATVQEGKAYLFPTFPLESLNHKEYLLGTLAKVNSKPSPVRVTISVSSADGKLNRREIELPLHRGRMKYSWDAKAAPWSLNLEPVPLLTIRRLWGDGLYGLPETATTLRKEPVVILDLHTNGGGNDRWAFQWCSIFSKQNYLAYRGMAELNHGKTDSLHRWSSLVRLDEQPRFKDSAASAVSQPYTGKFFAITGIGCASSGETFANLASQVPGVVTVGENTAGCLTYGNIDQTYDSSTGIQVHFGRTKFAMGKKPVRETVGMFPNYWLDTEDPVAAITAYCSLK